MPLFSNPVIPLPSFLFSKHIFIVQGIKQYLYFSELSGIIIPASKKFLIYYISEFISRSYSVIVSFPLPWFTVIRTGIQKMSFPLPIPPSNISKHYSEKKKKDSMWLQNTNKIFFWSLSFIITHSNSLAYINLELLSAVMKTQKNKNQKISISCSI